MMGTGSGKRAMLSLWMELVVVLLRSKDLKVQLARDIEWWRLNCYMQGSVPLAQN